MPDLSRMDRKVNQDSSAGRIALSGHPHRLSGHFLSILDLAPAELEYCLDLAASLKLEHQRGLHTARANALDGQHLAMLFEKPSLRTLSTFAISVQELGGNIIQPSADVVLGSREAPADVVRSLERWVSAAAIRTFSQKRLVEFCNAASRMRIINALTNEEHPCQALADCLTLREHWKKLSGKTLAFIGDGNNVATSITQASLMLGISVHLAAPEGFELSSQVQKEAARVARNGAELRYFKDPAQAVRGVAAVYTDVWTSMGKESEIKHREAVFKPYQVNRALMAHALEDALFLHCLPAHRGEEVTDEVIEGTTSVVFDQAENRLHTQKALLLMLLGGR